MSLITKAIQGLLIHISTPKTLHEWSPIDPKNSLEIIINKEPSGRLLWVYLEYNSTLQQSFYSLLGTPAYSNGTIIPPHLRIIDSKLQEIGKYLQTRYTSLVRAWTTTPTIHQIKLQKPKFPIELRIPEEEILFTAEEINRLFQY